MLMVILSLCGLPGEEAAVTGSLWEFGVCRRSSGWDGRRQGGEHRGGCGQPVGLGVEHRVGGLSLGLGRLGSERVP